MSVQPKGEANMDQNFNPLESQRDAIDFVRTMAHLNNQEKQNTLLEEQNRLRREANKDSAKERELESLFQKYKCSCYDRRKTGSLPRCRRCGGQKKVKFEEALAELGIDRYQAPRGKGRDDPNGELYWETQGLIFVDHAGRPKNPNRANSDVHSSYVQCPRCHGTGEGSYHCERCEDTGIPKDVRNRYL